MGSRCLFVTLVNGNRREPSPPARTIPFIAAILRYKSPLVYQSRIRFQANLSNDEVRSSGFSLSRERVKTEGSLKAELQARFQQVTNENTDSSLVTRKLFFQK